VRLIVEALRRGAESRDGPRALARDTLFAYFATQVFDRASPQTQRLLTRAALFPRFDVDMAASLSDEDAATDILDRLYRARLFTDRRGSPMHTYEFHALFREFLLARLRARGTPQEYRELEIRAAHLLEGAAYPADAFALHRSAENWADCIRIVLQEAEGLLDQGRKGGRILAAHLAAASRLCASPREPTRRSAARAR
jgi:ATP/maltotriose-dependent transcriptional regulator MalT